MPEIDLRSALNAISDVVQNRPPAIRELDQIYMKFGDLLLQAEHVSRHLDNKKTVFIGDGDAIGLCLMHLKSRGILKKGPKSILVLDFDERIVNSVIGFAEHFGLNENVTAELYNVVDAVPKPYWGKFDAFYTNPPFGSNNGGTSVMAFMQRGIECSTVKGLGCVVAADYRVTEWSNKNLLAIQRFALEHGYIVREMLPEFHQYHLDDAPELTSCSIVFKRISGKKKRYESKRLDKLVLRNFYGKNQPLMYKQVVDLTNRGKLGSRDYKLEGLEGKDKR